MFYSKWMRAGRVRRIGRYGMFLRKVKSSLDFYRSGVNAPLSADRMDDWTSTLMNSQLLGCDTRYSDHALYHFLFISQPSICSYHWLQMLNLTNNTYCPSLRSIFEPSETSDDSPPLPYTRLHPCPSLQPAQNELKHQASARPSISHTLLTIRSSRRR